MIIVWWQIIERFLAINVKIWIVEMQMLAAFAPVTAHLGRLFIKILQQFQYMNLQYNITKKLRENSINRLLFRG